jgi:hypothetical protein
VRICKYLSLGLLFLCPALVPSQEQAKPDAVKPGERLTGMWRGEYRYPQGSPQAPVKFELLLLHDHSTVAGVIKEPNTFGNQAEPFLAAVCRGKFDAGAGKVTFIKTYDGTAGPNHDVEYTGTLAKDGMKLEGTWDLGGFSGTFSLTRDKDTRAGPFAGVWSGTRHYPEAKGMAPVKFQAILVHKGDAVTGLIKEGNTAANQGVPYLHSTVTGKYDPRTGRLTFLEGFDGTGGQKHTLKCDGKVSFNREMVEGLWSLPNATAGRLTLLRLPLDRKTVGGLK